MWWDTRLQAGEVWDDVIERELNAARCVVVLWSGTSVGRHWVRAEANEGLRRRILVPALIEDVRPPLAFRLVQAESLLGWSGEPSHAGLNRLLAAIKRIIDDRIIDDQPKQPTPPPPSVNHRKRWISLLGALAVVAVTGGVVWRELGNSSTIRVPARPLDWSHGIFTSSNIHVEANQRVTFNAYGEWYIGAGSEGIGPEGVEAPCECVVSNEKEGGRQGMLGALIGKIGDTGKPFLIGAKKTITTKESGILFLGSNDNMGPCDGINNGSCYEDTRGTLKVKIQVEYVEEADTGGVRGSPPPRHVFEVNIGRGCRCRSHRSTDELVLLESHYLPGVSYRAQAVFATVPADSIAAC